MVERIVDLIAVVLIWLVVPFFVFIMTGIAMMFVMYIPYWLYKMALWLFQKDKLPYEEYQKEILEIQNNNIFTNIWFWTSVIAVINYGVVIWVD